MSRNKVVIWGASGHALVIADILRQLETFEIVGMLDDVNHGKHGSAAGGVTVLGGSVLLNELRTSGVTHLVVAIGDCAVRRRFSAIAVEKGFSLATAVHPRAVVARDTFIGEGTAVAAGAVINSGARIGRACIINTNATIEHECVIEDSVHIGPGAKLGGRAFVGAGTWIGIGATVLDRIRIGEDSIVGAGAVVTKAVPDRVVAFGVPCRVIRTNGADKKPV